MAEDSRLDYLERRVDEHTMNWDRLSARLDAVDQKLDRGFDVLEQKFDRRCDALEQKLDRRFESAERQFGELRAELSKQFRWTIRTMITLLGLMLTLGAGVATALLRSNP